MATSADFQEMWQDHYLDSGNTMQTMMLTEEEGAKQISRREIALLIAELGGVGGKAVLDLACGIGRFSRAFAARGATRVVGVDFVAEFIQGAQQYKSKYTPQIDFQHGNVLDVAVDGPFDIVFANWLCMYLSEDECHQLAARVKRWFAGRPGRFLLRESCDPEDPELAAAETGVDLAQNGEELVEEDPLAAADEAEGEDLADGVRLSEVSAHSVHPYYRPPQYYRDLFTSHGFTLRREGHVEADEEWHGDRNQIYFVFSYPGRKPRKPSDAKPEPSANRNQKKNAKSGKERQPATVKRQKDVPAEVAADAASASEEVEQAPPKRGNRFFCCFGR